MKCPGVASPLGGRTRRRRPEPEPHGKLLIAAGERELGGSNTIDGAVALVAQAPVGETGAMRPHRYPRPCPAPRSALTGYRFPPEVITLAVRWYLRFGLSYRDVEELLSERGIEVDHVSIYRWVQRFAPEFAEAARARQHVIGDRWHVDETYVKVGGPYRRGHRRRPCLRPEPPQTSTISGSTYRRPLDLPKPSTNWHS